jgi:hypothetical protein
MGGATSSASGCFGLVMCTQRAMKCLTKNNFASFRNYCRWWKRKFTWEVNEKLLPHLLFCRFAPLLPYVLYLMYGFISVCLNNFSVLPMFQILPLNNQ